MRYFLIFIGLVFLAFGAIATQAQSNISVADQIKTPYSAPNFGLKAMPGTEFSNLSLCQNDPLKFPDRRQLCIKIPDDPNYRTWWAEQYVDQLISMGWKINGSIDHPTFIRGLRGNRGAGCQSSMMVTPVYDGDMRKSDSGAEPEPINATYLVFVETTPNHCQIDGRRTTTHKNLTNHVVELTVPRKINLGAEFKISFTPTSKSTEHDRRTKEGTKDALWLGFMLEDVKTNKRTFLGDAEKIWSREFTRTINKKIPTGTYRVFAYEYNKQIRRRAAGYSEEFEILPVTEGSIWVLQGTEEQVCRKFAQTTNYIFLESRPRICGGTPCVDGPKSYLMPSGHVSSVMQTFGSAGYDSVSKIQCRK